MQSAASAHGLKLPFPQHLFAPVLVSVKTQAATLALPFFKVSENIPAEIYFKGVSFFIKSFSNLRQTEEQQAGGIL